MAQYTTAVNAAGESVEYANARRHATPRGPEMGRYRPTGSAYQSTPGTLESGLTNRYCLYAANRKGAIWRSDTHHARWPLQPAEAEIEHNSMTKQIGLSLPDTKPILHFAGHLEVVAWLPERLRRDQ